MFALEAGGADIIELGMPFSDPIGDGPTIQRSNTVRFPLSPPLRCCSTGIWLITDRYRERSRLPRCPRICPRST